MSVPPQAVSSDTGLYLDGKRLAPIQAAAVLTADIPAAQSDRVCLELRGKSWIPQQVDPAADDARTLGIQVFSVTMRAEGAGENVFNVNTGEQ